MPIIGGYTYTGKLTSEHLKLPRSMQRRVAASIKVVTVTDDTIVYTNLGTNLTHTFKKIGAEWIWQHHDKREPNASN